MSIFPAESSSRFLRSRPNPTIRDRVAQMATKLVIEPIFEADFCETSYGFKPKRSAHDAVDDVARTMITGYSEIIDADLSKYFDTIPHAKLMAVVAERISDGAILHLIRMWLKAPVMEVDRNGRNRNVGGGKGTPQGGESFRRSWPTSSCTSWIGYGRDVGCNNGWVPVSSDMPTILCCSVSGANRPRS